MSSDRLKSGIPGLDGMIGGGFMYPSMILIGGEPGTGKTTLAMQSLFYGASQGEQGLYITAISEPSWVVQKFLSTFNFYAESAIESEKVAFIDIGEAVGKSCEDTLEVIKRNVEKYEPKRVILDPVTAIMNGLNDVVTYRSFLHELMLILKTNGCVGYLTTEYSYQDIPRSVEAYMVDALILLSYKEVESARKKYIEVLKMRGTKHLTGKRSLVISDEGLRVQPELR